MTSLSSANDEYLNKWFVNAQPAEMWSADAWTMNRTYVFKIVNIWASKIISTDTLLVDVLFKFSNQGFALIKAYEYLHIIKDQVSRGIHKEVTQPEEIILLELSV